MWKIFLNLPRQGKRKLTSERSMPRRDSPRSSGRFDFRTLTWSCSKRCRSTRLLCRLLRDPWSQCDTAGIPGVCSACTSSRCCKTYRTARRIARICVLGAIVRCRRRWTPWTAPFFSGTVDQPSASCEHKAGCRRSQSRYRLPSTCVTPALRNFTEKLAQWSRYDAASAECQSIQMRLLWINIWNLFSFSAAKKIPLIWHLYISFSFFFALLRSSLIPSTPTNSLIANPSWSAEWSRTNWTYRNVIQALTILSGVGFYAAECDAWFYRLCTQLRLIIVCFQLRTPVINGCSRRIYIYIYTCIDVRDYSSNGRNEWVYVPPRPDVSRLPAFPRCRRRGARLNGHDLLMQLTHVTHRVLS